MDYDDRANLVDNVEDDQDEDTIATTSGSGRNTRYNEETIRTGNLINNAEIEDDSEEPSFDNTYRNIRSIQLN
jgi:hypothetical protein